MGFGSYNQYNEQFKKIRAVMFETDVGVLRLLTPMDCVKDILAAYYHWDDEQSLRQVLRCSLESFV